MLNSSNVSIVSLAPRRALLASHLESFLTKLEADARSKHTISAYRRDLSRVFEVLESLHPALTIVDVTAGLLDQALTAPAIVNTNRGQCSAASLHRMKAAVKSFFAWATDTGLLAENPARGVRLKRLPRKPPKFLTHTEKRKLLKELKGRNTPLNRRDRVMIEVFLGTGIRLGELVALDVTDVDLDAKHLQVRVKGGSVEVKFIKSDLRSLLRSYLKERRRQAPPDCLALFLSNRVSRISDRQVAHRLRHWLRKAGIAKSLSPHSLRHPPLRSDQRPACGPTRPRTQRHLDHQDLHPPRRRAT